MWNKLCKNIIFLSVSVSLIVFWVILVFTNVFYNLDKSISDRLNTQFILPKLKVSDRVVVVWIDSPTLTSLWRFPFARDKYIPVINNLKKSGATVIGFDVIFADDSDPVLDEQLSQSIADAGNVILGGPVIARNGKVFYEHPIPSLKSSSYWWGIFSVKTNPRNQKVYSVEARKRIGREEFNHFSIELLKAYYARSYGETSFMKSFPDDEHFFYITPQQAQWALREPRKIPYINRETQEIAVNYVSDSKIASESFINVYNNNFDPAFFRDKIVIIGATADGIKDVFFTPEGIKFGVYIHANIINSELTREFKQYFNKQAELLLIFFLIILSVYFNLSRSGQQLAWSNIWVISIFILIIGFIVVWLNMILNYSAQFVFALIITLTVSNIIKSFTEDKNKAKLSKALGEYVSKDIAREILNGQWDLNLDGQRKYLSFRFSDIKWFTTISEKLNPEELVSFLREYLWEMSNIIMDHRWFIDKYEWDAIMAMWWVFGYADTSTFDNCYCALLQQKRLSELNRDWKERFWEELYVRMWIHSWEAIVGNIGATGRKMEFTALWDSVNLASRLEWVNKLYGTYICVSEDVYISQKDTFEFRYLDIIRVQWKTIPICIYELLCQKWELSETLRDTVSQFDTAIALYKNREFTTARTLFQKLSLAWDAPSTTYLERCQHYLEQAPDESWDGVWNMQTK